MNINWKQPTTWLIVAFLILLAFMFTMESKAETRMEASVPFIGGDHYTGLGIGAYENFSGKWSLGVALLTELDGKRGVQQNNLSFQFQRLVRYKAIEAGIGGAYWHNQSAAWNSNTTFSLSIGFKFDHLSLTWRHYSTSGASPINSGLDLATVGWTF